MARKNSSFKKITPDETHTFHFRKSLSYLNPVLAKKQLNGVTVSISNVNGRLYAGVSCCSKNDPWNKGTGEMISKERAKLAAGSTMLSNLQTPHGYSGLPAEDIFAGPFTLSGVMPTKDLKAKRKAYLELAKEIVRNVSTDPGKVRTPRSKPEVRHETRIERIKLEGNRVIPLAVSI
jgi:hypothetical protein